VSEQEKTLHQIALEYFSQGCNIIPLKLVSSEEKKPLIDSWKKWQTQRQTKEEFDGLPWGQANGFGIVCGTQLSNGLYFGSVDFDVKKVTEEAKEKGRQALKQFPITQMEQTPSGGQHWIYFCHNKPRTVSSFHDQASLEILGENKLVIMSPSQGYKRLNDNTPTTIQDLEDVFYEALYSVGLKKPSKAPTKASTRKKRKKIKIRYCCEKALEKDRHISHLMRLMIASEYKKQGWSDNDVVDLFKHQDDFDKDKCLVQVRSADPERVATCESIREWGYCYLECPLREWTQDEAIDYELEKANSVELHPIIDYHPETGLTIGAFLETPKKVIQIIDKKLIATDSESLILEELNPIKVSLKQPSSKGLSRIQFKEILLLAKELKNSNLLARNVDSSVIMANEGEKTVGNLILQKVPHYFYHSDTRVYLAIACFIIVTYYHRLFSILGHLVFQGIRGSGKSTIGLLLKTLCWNSTSLQAGLRSAPLFRSIEASRPTFFADMTKVDIKDVDLIDLFEVIEQDGSVRRCVGEENEPTDFYVFCPKILMVRQSVPFSHKCIEFITEPAPKGTQYTERRRLIELDQELKNIRFNVLRNMITNWKQVLDAYENLQQDSKLFGRRFDLWRPLLAVCKIYYLDRYDELLKLAYEDAERAEKGDVTSDVEDLLLAYFLSFETIEKQSQMFYQKDLTKYAQDQLGQSVVRSFHIVASALKNLGVIKRKTKTSSGVEYQVDLVKAHAKANERNIEKDSEEAEKNALGLVSIDDLISVHWSDSLSEEKECGICGYKKMTSWQGETNKGEKIPVCEDCQREFEKRREVS